jgi:uncharacterized protein with PIN domain
MLYLIRFAETGREAQPCRSRLKRDIVAVLLARIPGARIRTETGRIFLETDADAIDALRELHGVASFSPCRWCSLSGLEECVLGLAAEVLPGARSYRLRIRHLGAHALRSRQLEVRLGRRIGERWPHLRVDLSHPDKAIGIEIRGADCYVFDAVHPGVDRRRDLEPPALAEPRFLVDQMLGKLVGWLRVLGYDTDYARDRPDSWVLRKCREEGRILLTRDRALSRTRAVHVLHVSSRSASEQLREVVFALRLGVERRTLFTRCVHCNRPVAPVGKEQILHRLPPVAVRHFDEFTRCAACDKVYWRGEHYRRVVGELSDLIGE